MNLRHIISVLVIISFIGASAAALYTILDKRTVKATPYSELQNHVGQKVVVDISKISPYNDTDELFYNRPYQIEMDGVTVETTRLVLINSTYDLYTVHLNDASIIYAATKSTVPSDGKHTIIVESQKDEFGKSNGVFLREELA